MLVLKHLLTTTMATTVMLAGWRHVLAQDKAEKSSGELGNTVQDCQTQAKPPGLRVCVDAIQPATRFGDFPAVNTNGQIPHFGGVLQDFAKLHNVFLGHSSAHSINKAPFGGEVVLPWRVRVDAIQPAARFGGFPAVNTSGQIPNFGGVLQGFANLHNVSVWRSSAHSTNKAPFGGEVVLPLARDRAELFGGIGGVYSTMGTPYTRPYTLADTSEIGRQSGARSSGPLLARDDSLLPHEFRRKDSAVGDGNCRFCDSLWPVAPGNFPKIVLADGVGYKYNNQESRRHDRYRGL